MHQRIPRAPALEGRDVPARAPLLHPLPLRIRHLGERVFLFDVLQHLLRLRGRERVHVARRQDRRRCWFGRWRRELRLCFRLGLG